MRVWWKDFDLFSLHKVTTSLQANYLRDRSAQKGYSPHECTYASRVLEFSSLRYYIHPVLIYQSLLWFCFASTTILILLSGTLIVHHQDHFPKSICPRLYIRSQLGLFCPYVHYCHSHTLLLF